ncbi:MAG: hypothetical protein AAF828_01540 [Bacteroidota bacterium]
MVPLIELAAYPRLKSVIVSEGGGTPAPGDTKRLGEAFDYNTGGYHREIDILTNTGSAQNTLEGEIGGQENRARVEYFIPGNSPQVREHVDCLVANSGCISLVVPAKDGQNHVIGTPDNPVFIESYEGGTGGDRNGFLIVVFSDHPVTYTSIDLAEFPLGLTPAA